MSTVQTKFALKIKINNNMALKKISETGITQRKSISLVREGFSKGVKAGIQTEELELDRVRVGKRTAKEKMAYWKIQKKAYIEEGVEEGVVEFQMH